MFSSVSRWGSNDLTSGVPLRRRNDQYKRRGNAARRDFNKMYFRGFYYYHFCFSFLFLYTLINLHFWPTSNCAWRQYYNLDWWRTIDNKSNKTVRRLLYASRRSVLILATSRLRIAIVRYVDLIVVPCACHRFIIRIFHELD